MLYITDFNKGFYAPEDCAFIMFNGEHIGTIYAPSNGLYGFYHLQSYTGNKYRSLASIVQWFIRNNKCK